MQNDRIDKLLGYLAEVGAFLSEVKFRAHEHDKKIKISEAVENYLDGFNISQYNCEVQPPVRYSGVSKLNTLNVQFWTAKEIEEMPYFKDLKYRITADGLHQFRYRREGYDVQFTSKNLEVAKKKARNFIRSLKSKWNASNIQVKHVNTLNDVAKKWFKMKSVRWERDTARAYVSVYRNHIESALGNFDVAKILPLDIQPLFDSLSARGLGKTTENVKTILNGVFNYSVSNRFCPTNPLGGVIIDKHVRTIGRRLSDEEIAEFKATVGPVKDFGILYLIILYTGVRGCEIQEMKFDWEKGTCTVRNGKLKRYQKKNPNNLYRTFPIFPALYSLRERIETETWRYKDRIVSNRFSDFWTKSPVKSLRHTFSSKAREAGIENELVNVWMGHLPGTNQTANTYTHFSEEFQQEQAKKLLPY